MGSGSGGGVSGPGVGFGLGGETGGRVGGSPIGGPGFSINSEGVTTKLRIWDWMPKCNFPADQNTALRVHAV